MGDVTMAINGLLPKINSLFNSPVYSDVQFIFMLEDGKSEKIYCHKLILALQSKVFAHIFYEKETSPSIMKMQASKKELFYNLFKFLYTGDVNFHTFVEAQNLYELANDYLVEELVIKCHNYMLQDRLTIKNVFSKYEHALNQQFDALLRDCRNFVCSYVQLILKSNEFTNASSKVVEDIVKLDNIPLTTELEIITAVFNWGLESLRKNEMSCNGENLRKSVDPFLKHLRILSLSSSEFDYIVKQYDIFNAYESMTLMQKIIMPESSKRPPENFCCIASKRCTTTVNNKTPVEYQEYNSAKSNSPKSVRLDPPKLLKFDNNKISYEVCKYPVKDTTKNTTLSSSKFKQKFNSSPNIRNIDFPAPVFSQNVLKHFLFPLKKGEKSFTLSFPKDIKCSVNIKMKSGNLSLHGFELKIKCKSEKKEQLEVYVYWQEFSKQYFEKSYNLELQNDEFSVMFPKPMKLQEGSESKLEICIENLSLDRCCQINKKLYILNSGLDFECDFRIDSNKKTEDDENFLFLINKLIYMPF